MDKQMKSSRAIPPTGIRFPPDLKERLHESAENNGRSFTAEVIYRTELGFKNENTEERIDDDRIEEAIAEGVDRAVSRLFRRGIPITDFEDILEKVMYRAFYNAAMNRSDDD